MAFSEAVQAVLDWAQDRNDTLIIVTADHETSGLQIDGDSISWVERTKGSHTTTPVNYYAYGTYHQLMKENIDNTDIFKICYSYLNLAS